MPDICPAQVCVCVCIGFVVYYDCEWWLYLGWLGAWAEDEENEWFEGWPLVRGFAIIWTFHHDMVQNVCTWCICFLPAFLYSLEWLVIQSASFPAGAWPKYETGFYQPQRTMPVNSVDIETGHLLCGTDGEAIFVYPNCVSWWWLFNINTIITNIICSPLLASTLSITWIVMMTGHEW